MEEWLTDDVSIIFAPEEEMPPTSPSESTAASVASSALSADQQPGSFVNSTTRSGDTNNRVWYDI
jgi:pantothenate synthetase